MYPIIIQIYGWKIESIENPSWDSNKVEQS